MLKEFKSALFMLLLMTLLTGGLYPALITGLSQTLFPYQAHGSLIHHQGTIVGSNLIGQPFSDAGYFWSRPSATTPMPYNAGSSSGSNTGPTNPDLETIVKDRITSLKESNPQQKLPIPVDLVTASASGLDPHISPAAAQWQIPRVAQARGLSEQALGDLVTQHTEGRTFGILGEPRVNILTLNQALDQGRAKP
ncbi:MAG: potassium-transporting ATPase subunit KdpC [Magnetococcales bacterium]|nr:potassium-transporting ATPase subunit KdpC [Magnetococcales bacterium]